MEEPKFSTESAVSLKIGGITVKFPAKPYPSQLSMMSMIIKGLEKGQHCLLESPTGSGKSLALLCSALAWQQAQYEKSENEFLSKLTSDVEKKNPPCTCIELNKEADSSASTSKYFDTSTSALACSTKVIDLCTPEDDDEDFKKESKQRGKQEKILCPGCLENKEKDKCCSEEKNSEDTEYKKPRIPKIWFGTRTHKQIAQITKELGRTSYESTKMTILSSRQHSCIHPAVMKSSNKNEECRDLRRGTHALGAKCAFYQNVHRMKNHYQLGCAGISSAWDLEDLVGLGKTIKACPYYSAKELVSSSNIIFCPYNYLIDPMIRSQMQINPKNQIIILDEAHNIEDSAREAGSFTMTEDSLANTTTDLEYLINDGIKIEDHRPLHLLCMRLGQWITEHARNLNASDYETSTQVWYGRDIIDHLKDWGITQDTLPLLEGNYSAAIDLGEEDIETAKILHSSSQATLGGLFNVLRYLMTEEYKYCDDYRVTIIRQMVFGPIPPKRTRDGWVTLNKRSKKHSVTNLHFWCLNPAVAFNDLSGAHSIILTSGTLSPMSSFSSELGLSFPIQLEANHVIKDSQVWVGSIGRGPKGIQLEATYKNTDRFEFQDELGSLIHSVCRVVPHGVLCFVSSYNMLKKLQERWQTTGLWNSIDEMKTIVCEPRSSSKDEFDSLLQSFYDAVKESEEGNIYGGSLLLAVCRGKVSEGLDFADNNARAVITVGIPFPSIKDKQVELKRKYNDIHRNQRGLLSGAQWYEIQAFRAMNQALGRCIRHKTDWGALIIVDERFCKNPKKYNKGLSKWVRQKMIPYPSYDNAMSNITAFVQRQMSENGSNVTNDTTMHVDSTINLLDAASTSILPTPVSNTFFTSSIRNADSSLKENVQPKLAKIFLNKSVIKSVAKEKRNPAKTETADNSVHKDEIHFSPDEDFQNESVVKVCKSSGKKKSAAKSRFRMNTAHMKNNNDLDSAIVCNDTTCKPMTNISHEEPMSRKTSTQLNFSKAIKEAVSKSDSSGVSKVDLLSFGDGDVSHNVTTINNISDMKTEENDIMYDDLFDCTIPATPEKMDNITIIPESPASMNGDSMPTEKHNVLVRQALDFGSEASTIFSSTRKRKPEQSHNDVSTPYSKRTDNAVSCDQNSGEFLPRSKRRQLGTKENKKTSSEAKSVLSCKNCTVNLYKTGEVVIREHIESPYIIEKFLKMNSKYPITEVFSIEEKNHITDNVNLITVKYRNDSSVELNSVWCEVEQRCFQMFECSCCGKIVAFKIPSDPQLNEKYFYMTERVLETKVSNL